MMIARTEVMTAANQGRFISWQQAGDRGLIDLSTAYKEWIAEDDACDECSFADGEFALAEEDFESVGEGMPPAHPNCRCTAVLVPAEDVDPAVLEEQAAARAERDGEEGPTQPDAEDLTSLTEEPLTPIDEIAAAAIDEIRSAIDEIPSWETGDFKSIMNEFGKPSESILNAEESVRSVGSLVDTEVRRRMEESGISMPFRGSEAEMKALQQESDRLLVEELKFAREARREMALADGFDSPWKWSQEKNLSEDQIRNLAAEHSPEYAQVRKDLANVSEEIKRLDKGEGLMNYADVLRDVMAEVRPMTANDVDIAWGDTNWKLDKVEEVTKLSKEMSEKALEFYPKAWIENSSQAGDVWVGMAEGNRARGYCSSLPNGQGLIHIPNGDKERLSLYVHEWGHRMEATNPKIKELEYAFVNRRSEGKVERKLSTLTGNKSYKKDEKAFKDKFASPYTGKVYMNYPGSSWEVLTTGMEGLTTNRYGILAGDTDFLHFVLGMLAGI
jgi:hypothetical protein